MCKRLTTYPSGAEVNATFEGPTCAQAQSQPSCRVQTACLPLWHAPTLVPYPPRADVPTPSPVALDPPLDVPTLLSGLDHHPWTLPTVCPSTARALSFLLAHRHSFSAHLPPTSGLCPDLCLCLCPGLCPCPVPNHPGAAPYSLRVCTNRPYTYHPRERHSILRRTCLRAAGATGTGRPAVLWARTSLWAVLET